MSNQVYSNSQRKYYLYDTAYYNISADIGPIAIGGAEDLEFDVTLPTSTNTEMLTPGLSTIKVNYEGMYSIMANIGWDNASSQETDIQISLLLDRPGVFSGLVLQLYQRRNASNVQPNCQNLATTFYLYPNDTFRVRVQNISGTPAETITVLSAVTNLIVNKIN